MLSREVLSNQALEAYQEGHYAEATQCIESAIAMGAAWLLLPLADIYHRALDGRVRAPEQAAALYLEASDCGEGDATSYLNSLSPALIDETRAFSERVSLLVDKWNQ
jgi:hypothetical protein